MNENDIKDFLLALFEKIGPKTDEDLFMIYEKKFVPESFEVLEDIFTGYFKKVEGSACSADKGRFVAEKLIESTQKKETLSLIESYADYQASGGNIGSITEINKVCYWCPKTIADTKEALSLYNQLTSLNFEFILSKIKEAREI